MEHVLHEPEKEAAEPFRNAHQSPSVIVNISDGGDATECFLLVYKTDTSGIFDKLAVVTANAVYKGGKSCVEKPTTKKRLDDDDHLSKVLTTILSVSSMTAGEYIPHGGIHAAAVLPVKFINGEAVVTVKEALRRGSSFVELATIRLPSIKEVVQKLLERAALVINAKKAMIANLQDQGSDDEASGGEGWSDADNEGTIAAGEGYRADPNPAPGDQLMQAASPTRVGKMPRDSDKVGSVSGAAERGSLKGRGGKVRLEPGDDSVAGMGEGCGALAVPLGTQEVSGGDLMRHVTGKRVRDGDDFGAVGSGEDGGVSKVKPLRPIETPSISPGKRHVGPTDDNYGDGVDDSSSDNEALKLFRDDSDSNSSVGDTEGRRKLPRRRRKAKKSKPVVKEERVEAEDPKKPEGSVDMKKITSGFYDDLWEDLE